MNTSMTLQVCVPTEVLVDETVVKIIAESSTGSFCLLPRHTDYLATLVPGLLMFVRPSGEEVFLASDAGLVVKRGKDVFVSLRQAFAGTDLISLREVVRTEFETLDEKSRNCQSAVASLEASFLRRFLELDSGAAP